MKNKKLLMLTQAAVIAALIFALDITGLGYIPLSIATVSILSVPVCVGAVAMGPVWGAVFGGIFGLSSFLQCFGKSAFGTLMFDINPIYCAIVCFIPRILMGLLCGLVFKFVYGAVVKKTGEKSGKTNIAFAVAGAAAPLFNTVFFMTALVLLYFNNPQFAETYVKGAGVFAFTVGFVGIGAVLELAAGLVISTAISKAVFNLQKKIH